MNITFIVIKTISTTQKLIKQYLRPAGSKGWSCCLWHTRGGQQSSHYMARVTITRIMLMRTPNQRIVYRVVGCAPWRMLWWWRTLCWTHVVRWALHRFPKDKPTMWLWLKCDVRPVPHVHGVCGQQITSSTLE